MDKFSANHSMEEISEYIISSDHGMEQLREYDVVLNEDATMDIVFKDGKKLSDFLPSELKIIDTPDFNKPLMHRNLSENGEVQSLEVRINHEWLKEGRYEKVAIFAHEIGHALATEEEILRNKKLKDLYEHHPPFEILDDNVKSYMTFYFLKRASNTLENETQAWNYGKIIASLFGVSDTQYEDVMRPQIEGMYYAVYSPTYDAIKELYKGDLSLINREIAYPIYDLTQQEEIQVTAEELLSIFKELDENKYRRNEKEIKRYKGY